MTGQNTSAKKPGTQKSQKSGAKSTSKSSRNRWLRAYLAPFRDGSGPALFVLALLAVAILSSLSLNPGETTSRVYMAGEIAREDVAADRDILIEDTTSTRAKREQVAEAQPPVYDLKQDPAADLATRVGEIFAALNAAPAAQLEELRWQLAESLNTEVSRTSFDLWRNNEFQNLVLVRVLPEAERLLKQGVLSDKRMAGRFDNGLLVRDPATGREMLRMDLTGLPDLATARAELSRMLRYDLGATLRTRTAVMELVGKLMDPSLTLNRAATEARRDEAVDAVEPVYYRIARGEVIVRQGERVDEADQQKLQALVHNEEDGASVLRPLGMFLVTLLISLGFVLSPTGRLVAPMANKSALLLTAVLLLWAGFAKVTALANASASHALPTLVPDLLAHGLPVAGAAGLLAMFLPLSFCMIASLLLAFTATQLMGGDLSLFAYHFIGATLYSVLIKRAQARAQLLRSVGPLLAGLLLAYAGTRLMDAQLLPMSEFSWLEPATVLGCGLLSLFVVLAFSQVFELLFGFTSRFRLMELMNLEQPLLQELMVQAPGSYHHSLIVANMVEAGARSIRANALLCKVAALYHDIGKLDKPLYFIENQPAGKNRHDKLAPSMSALILTSHVKKGAELAHKHRLGQEIADIILQHHGTSLISYFHNKAVEAQGQDAVSEEDFRYPGPKPQTKEAGIVMLADAIEASARALVDPTPSRIRGHIQTMTKKIFTEGQLDESELTLKDLHQLSSVFERILTGIFHQRIEYPGAQSGKDAARKKERTNVVPIKRIPPSASAPRVDTVKADPVPMAPASSDKQTAVAGGSGPEQTADGEAEGR